MYQLITFLTQIELPIYIVLGIIFSLVLRRTVMSFRETNTALYKLEKEIAQRKFVKNLTSLILLTLLIIAEFIVTVFVYPNLPNPLNQTMKPTPTQTATPPSTTPQAVPTDATPTPTPHPQAQIEGEPSNCQAGILEFTQPTHLSQVSGVVELIGSVNTSNFGSYKYEYSPVNSINWIIVAAGNELRVEQTIGSWYTTSLEPGNYFLKLVPLDNLGVEQTPCIIEVMVVSEE